MTDEIEISCACANARRAARLVSKLYAQEMGKALEPGQFALLSVLNGMPGRGQSPLARNLGLDKTTLSRNLLLMQKRGWIERVSGDDQRERGYRLTPKGGRLLAEARPRWQKAQEKFRAAMTPAEWEAMMSAFRAVGRAVQKAQAD